MNAQAGRFATQSPVDALQLAIAQEKLPVVLVAPENAEEMAESIRSVCRGAQRVIVAGGDGTVELAARIILEQGIPVELGIVPTGTVNNLARNLGIPRSLSAALQLALSGSVQEISVGQANDAFFFETLGVGIFAEALAQRQRPRSLPDILWSFLRAQRVFQPPRIQLSIDGTEVSSTVLQCSVMNTSAFAGWTVVPGQSLGTDTFSVIAVSPQPIWRLFGEYRQLLHGAPEASPSLTLLQGREILIRAIPAIPVHADDHIIGRTPVTVRPAAGRLSVVYPKLPRT